MAQPPPENPIRSSPQALIQPPDDVRSFEALLEVVKALRGPDGCPWDKEQTHRTLAPFAIEESHELAEAIEHGDVSEIVSELGDVLLQVALNAEIGRQDGAFAIEDVIESIVTKMVRRHPHVFAQPTPASGGEAKTSEQVLKNWAEIKKAERAAKGPKAGSDERPFDVPLSLPALSRSQKIGAKTKAVGFDWDDWRGAMEKVDEELRELKEACASGSSEEREHELGDLLFSLAQVARHLKLEAEQALRTANARFERRYASMRAFAAADGEDFDSLSTDRMEEYWRRAKAQES